MLSEKPWTLERAALLVIAVVFGFSAISMAAGLAGHFSPKGKLDENSLGYLFLLTMSIHGSILVAAAVVLWWYRLSWGEAFGFSSPRKLQAVLWGILGAFVFLPVGILLQSLSITVLSSLGLKTPVQDAIETFNKTDSWDSRAYFILFSIVIAPMAEEILFRGVMYPAVKRLGFPRAALWGSAFVFAAIHANLPIFLPLLVLGLALALLYEKTDNLLAPITAHGVFNAVNILYLYFGQRVTTQPY